MIKLPRLGAALAYYTVFSLAPLLIISIALAGLVFGAEAAQGQIFDQLRGLLGDASGKAMQEIVQSASAEPKTGVVATVIGLVTLLVRRLWRLWPAPSVLEHNLGCSPSQGAGSLASFAIAFFPSALS